MEVQGPLRYMIHHVFLPPKLPQKDDTSPKFEGALLNTMIECITKFQSLIAPNDEELTLLMLQTIQRLRIVHNDDVAGEINVEQLAVVVEDVRDKGGMIALPIRAQNAGVLISKANATHIHFEVMELSPTNGAVMGAKGRLKRSFPGSAVAVEVGALDQPQLRSVITQTLADMSSQSVAGTQPRVRKAGQSHDEDRDTTHPKIVTELFVAFLNAIGKPVSVSGVGKNTREEVIWHNSLLPWRRSPLWLFVRVTLQLLCLRRAVGSAKGHSPYKTLMILFMSQILDAACERRLSTDDIYTMKAKISRRLLKLRAPNDQTVRYIDQVLRNADEMLCRQWTVVQRQTSLQIDLSKLAQLNFAEDIAHSLPRLDGFLQSIASWRSECKPVNFQAQSVLPHYHAGALPSVQPLESDDDATYGLHAVETWVASHLETWLNFHETETTTTQGIVMLITQYHELARARYLNDPQALSIMLLTVLELWVACDRSTTLRCELLGDYDPGVPVELFQSLHLSNYHEMERLYRAEEYLRLRRQRAIHGSSGIFRDFGTPSCFAVKYFEQSPKHQTLMDDIENHADRMRTEKCRELGATQDHYRHLMSMADQLDCEYTSVPIDWERGHEEHQHKRDCQRCRYRSQAQGLTVQVHEWPLPQRQRDAKSTVFELMVPQAFGWWRDVTAYLLGDVLHTTYLTTVRPRSSHPLSKYQGLSSFYLSFAPAQRVCLLSQEKPHKGTHRSGKSLAVATEADICVNNGLRYRYYDNRAGQFTDDFVVSQRVAEELTFQLPERSQALHKYIFRPASISDGPPHNEVIASQSDCPVHMSLDEYKALASISLGHRIQWLNLLVQLAAPSVDFKKEESTLVALQCIFQVGPPNGSVRRASHEILQDESFTTTALTQVRDALERVRANWESSEALNLFINLTLRVLSLGGEETVVDAALDLLTDLRRTTFGWVILLRDKASHITDSLQRSELMAKAVEIALVCVQSFDVDERYLDRLMARAPEASIFLQCSIFISEGLLDMLKDPRYMSAILQRRWMTLSCRAFPYLSSSIIAGTNSCLDEALAATWPAYRMGGVWQSASAPEEDWLTKEMSDVEMSPLSMHFNLITGQLLVGGLPLSRLPGEYERSPAYRRLFGRRVLDVMPSSASGTQFSTRTEYAGHMVYFGLGGVGGNRNQDVSELRVQSFKNGAHRIHVPLRLLTDDFPAEFSAEFVHWYDTEAQTVEFCPVDQAWTTSAANWRLIRCPDHLRWRLTKGATNLVNMHSTTARAVSAVLTPLDQLSHTHVVFDPSSATIQIELPRLQLEFYLASGKSALYSKQYRGMMVDASQDVGTLIGLRNKLVLRHNTDQSRLLIIPEAPVSCGKEFGHLSVSIDHDKVTRFHAFTLDILLGRLLDNGSVQSKLYLAYLHALTSFCVPDPLTKRFGTEQALSILRSAHVRSFDQIDQVGVDILEKLASLTPGRQYYPAHERVMQTLQWRSDLSPLAQHGMLAVAVRSIFDSLHKTKLFYPGNKVLIPSLEHVDWDLLQRDNIRSSTFRTANFGAEQYTTKDDDAYTARDTGQRSADAGRSFQIASFVYQGQSHLCFSLPRSTSAYMWEHLLPARETRGPAHMFTSRGLTFDAEWLREPFEHLARYWTSFHQRLTKNQTQANKFALMMWLSTLAFSTTVDINLVIVLASFLVLPEMRDIQVPTADTFRLHLGTKVTAQMLRSAVHGSLKSFRESPEFHGIGTQSRSSVRNAKHTEFQTNQNQAVRRFVDDMVSRWPCRTPDAPVGAHRVAAEKYLNVMGAMCRVLPVFENVFNNRCFFQYLNDVQQVLSRLPVQLFPLVHAPSCVVVWNVAKSSPYVSVDDIFAGSGPLALACPTITLGKLDLLSESGATSDATSLPALLDRMQNRTASSFELKYLRDLRDSHRHLSSVKSFQVSLKNERDTNEILSYYQRRCKESVEQCFQSLYRALCSNNTICPETSVAIQPTLLKHFARVSPVFFLEQLSRARWNGLTSVWRKAIVHYAVCLTQLQQAGRMLRCADQRSELLKELQNPGHSSWNPLDQPETLLLEVESGIMVRDVQQRIAQEMRDPRTGGNVTVQLNMGEGKSSVIMPITAVSLADTSRLVRIIVAKPLARQMFQVLTSKMGNLLNRRVYRMPFSRDLPLDDDGLRKIHEMCKECMEEGGVLLVQPEHLLSVKLRGLEHLVLGRVEMARAVTQLLGFFDNFARDLVDESDEIFNVKFELVYSMGTQQPLELSPERWTCLQRVLEVVQSAALQLHQDCPAAVEIRPGRPGSFPKIRMLHGEAQKRLNHLVAQSICATGFHGFPIAQQQERVRQAVQKYICEADLSAEDIAQVEHESAGFWADATKGLLILLRGLLAGGILAFALRHKRWRVSYGRDATRRPVKRLAVPYRAKDSPSPRSEFSHPDVVMILTSLSYYYDGLNDDDLFDTLSHLLKSDQADVEYQAWVTEAPELPTSYHQLHGINLRDRQQCTVLLFPPLRYIRSVVNYFLSHIVFPKEMREFPRKLTASGWDIGESKRYVTTGFSGTTDLSPTLPLSVRFEKLYEQEHTNALVLECLLRPEHSVAMLPPAAGTAGSDFDLFLDIFRTMRTAPRVILDVGAQILDYDNLGVAREWLRAGYTEDVQAVVFFDDNDELCVLDRDDRVEVLQISPFARHLDLCLVYLDEAHTRGTDLELPDSYLAAVTLGPNVTKDRLVQACMRMRKLGQGQAVVFCVSQEIRRKIVDCTGKRADGDIEVADILHWAVSETFADLRRTMPLWAVQGKRFERQDTLWNSPSSQGRRNIGRARAKKFLEDECLSLEHRYRPHARESDSLGTVSAANSLYSAIDSRCREFQSLSSATAQLQEEQERELSPEVEQERCVERPAPAAPADHEVHLDLISFVSSGALSSSSPACMPAFQALKSTSANLHFDVSCFPHDLWVTCDFARTVKAGAGDSVLDAYQRSVQWILVGSDSGINGEANSTLRVVVISPHEAQYLLPSVKTSRNVSLHLYAPRTNLGFRPLDHLSLYTMPSSKNKVIPPRAIILLNIFAGQLYFDVYEEYVRVCDFLGVVCKPSQSNQIVAADGFIKVRAVTSRRNEGFVSSPIQCLKVLLSKIRRNGECIDKTHVGKLLGAVLLHPCDISAPANGPARQC